MVSKVTSAKLKGSAPLSPAEAALVEAVVISRPTGFWNRFKQGVAYATKLVPKEEFDRICVKLVEDLDDEFMHPEDAAAKAKRVIEAYTQAHATVFVPKCAISDTAIMVAWLGEPRSGFLFQRAFKLKDPRGAKRG